MSKRGTEFDDDRWVGRIKTHRRDLPEADNDACRQKRAVWSDEMKSNKVCMWPKSGAQSTDDGYVVAKGFTKLYCNRWVGMIATVVVV